MISTIDAAGSTVTLSSKINLLGVTLNGNLNFNDQVKNVWRASFFHMRMLRHIRPSLTEEMANVACALVPSRVDYANSLHTGMSSANFDKLRLVQNTLARVLLSSGNGTTSSHRSRDFTGYRSVNVSISMFNW